MCKCYKNSIRLNAIKLTIIVVSLSSLIYSCFPDSPQFEKGDKQTKELKKISGAEIDKIEMYESSLCEKRIIVPKINSDESKKLFAHGVNDLSKYFPNHDSATKEFYIIMFDIHGKKYEFDTYLKSSDDKIVYMHLVERPLDEEVYLRNLGSRKSISLYKWLVFHDLIM